MDINIISSSSKANAVVVSDGHSRLLLDAGLTYRELARRVKPSSLAGILITHEHADHCRAVPELARRGLNVAMSRGTAEALSISKHFNGTILKHGQQVDIGTWAVLPFDCNHDAAEPLGFLFQSRKTGEKGLYIVDSSIVDFDFPGVSHFLIEANYAEDILNAGPYEEFVKDRVRQSHMSLENLKTFFRTTDLSRAEEIHLLHLSDANSDATRFETEIQSLTGVPVYA